MAKSLKMLWLLTAVAAFGGGASAQTTLRPGEELRPLYATGDDVAAGRELAAATCVKCHGPLGQSADKSTPSLAGQRPAFLYRVLKAYQSGDPNAGAGPHNLDLMKFLSDDALSKVAAYYASLEPISAASGAAPAYVDPVALGKAAAVPCAKCHGETGISHKAGVPSLVGLHPKYLLGTMQGYKSGDRPVDDKNKDMKTALDALSDDDLGHIALYYALQTEGLTHAQTPAETAAAPTKDALAVCVKCHGENGVSTTPITPSLAGQDYAYLLSSIHAYKDGTRDDDSMSPRAKKLDDAAMKTFAAYYASLTPQPTGVAKPLSPAEWAEKCDRCHGPGGNSTRPDVPALAGQRLDYLAAVLTGYRGGDRKSPEMTAMTSILTDDDIKGLAAHYAYQKPRAVVYVTVPAK